MKSITMYTDGACLGNPGPGGYGIVLIHENARKELYQGYKITTNNRMELLAVIVGLEAIKQPSKVSIFSDSQYVVNSIIKGWVFKWQKNNWRKGDKKRAENVDLWERLLPLLSIHECHFEWVRGHSGVPENERADELSVMGANGTDLLDDQGFTVRTP